MLPARPRPACVSLLATLVTAAAILVAPATVHAQDESPQEQEMVMGAGLRVYMDCATFRCDRDRFRREITFVQWVRQPQDSDVHVIMTSQAAGGGQRFIFDFEGRGELDGTTDRLAHAASTTDVEEEVLEALTQTLRLGLVRFVALAGYADAVSIEATEPVEGPAGGGTVEDPWNYWVFSTRLSAEVEAEDREESQEVQLSASANRTTEAWKLDLGFFGEFSREEFEFDDETETFTDEDWSLDAVAVKSLTEHWSVGASSDVGSSTRFNQKVSFELLPAVEWNYYPWQDASRRRFVVFYGAGIQYVDYNDMTIFERNEETLWRHRLDVEYRAQESWGDARMGVEANQILDGLDKYSFEFQGNVNYRILRGLSVEVGGSYEIIRDQIYLSAEGLTPGEIFTERRQQETGSRLSFDVGIRYSFGSILNNIVNSRFPSLSRFGGGGN
jgi:hypothetical protein